MSESPKPKPATPHQLIDAVEHMLSLLAEGGLSDDQSAYLDIIRGNLGSLRAIVPPARGAGSSTPSGNPNSTQKGKVLVVDDDAVSQVFAVQALRSAGYEVLTAKHGADALILLLQHDIDLMLLDCELPVMDGFETTHLIRSGHCPGKEGIPIIAFTSHSMVGYPQRCKQVGMNGFLKKPASIQGIQTAVEQGILAHRTGVAANTNQ